MGGFAVRLFLNRRKEMLHVYIYMLDKYYLCSSVKRARHDIILEHITEICFKSLVTKHSVSLEFQMVVLFLLYEPRKNSAESLGL